MKKSYGIIAIIISSAFWGMSGVILIPRLSNLSVPMVVFLQYVIPFLVLNIFMIKEYKYIKKITMREIILISIIAIFGGIIGSIAIVKALFLMNFQHLSVVVLIQKVQPIFAIVFASILLKEKISKNFFKWVAFVLIAGYFLTFGLHLPNITSKENLLLAACLAVIAAFSFSLNTVIGKMLTKTMNVKTLTFYRYGFTSIFITILLLIIGGFADFSKITAGNVSIIFIILVTSGPPSMFLFYYGLKRVKANVAAICELSLPITAVLLDCFINKSYLSSVQWTAAIIMVYGIYAITKNQNNIKN